MCDNINQNKKECKNLLRKRVRYEANPSFCIIFIVWINIAQYENKI